ncbi:neuropeptides capa receptor-like [Penaeus indicus]|uniref:neuropeptides capa receptor-like n=1 Tax=Penaeus indicus TaxID=29960 RepID=UPI00300D1F0E
MDETGVAVTSSSVANASALDLSASTLAVTMQAVFSSAASTLAADNDTSSERESQPHNLTMMVAMTVIYIAITIVGVVGNVITCIVIVRNRIMHTATNYYLFSMAISDLLLLAFGMPDEIQILWMGKPYIFGEEFCFIRGFTAEISTNASILTIAAFTVERYIGICHPLRSHTMSQLGRVIRFIAIIWVVATACAVPIAIQYGIVYKEDEMGKKDLSTASCVIKNRLRMVFEISSVLFFVAPMLLIIVLYVFIAIQLKRSARLARNVPSLSSHSCSTNDGSRNKSVIKMLVAVVIAFFLCFAPHQAQRLMAVHADPRNIFAVKMFNVLHNISGISYYISTCVNPILYHIFSNRFRQAFRKTLESCCVKTGGGGGVGGGGGGGRWHSRSQSARSQHTHTFELTEQTFLPEANHAALAPTAAAAAAAAATTTTITTSSSDVSTTTTTTLEFEAEDERKSRRGKRKTHIVQELNGVRKAGGRVLMGKHVAAAAAGGKRNNTGGAGGGKGGRRENGERGRGGGGITARRFRPLFMPRLRRPEVVENPIDLFVASTSPSSRKRSQSDSLLSGGSISNCSMTHIEQEFTQKELSEVMGRMKNVDA